MHLHIGKERIKIIKFKAQNIFYITNRPEIRVSEVKAMFPKVLYWVLLGR